MWESTAQTLGAEFCFMNTVSQYISIDFAEISAGLHRNKDQHLDDYPTAYLFLSPLLCLLTDWCYQAMCIFSLLMDLPFSRCLFP